MEPSNTRIGGHDAVPLRLGSIIGHRYLLKRRSGIGIHLPGVRVDSGHDIDAAVLVTRRECAASSYFQRSPH